MDANWVATWYKYYKVGNSYYWTPFTATSLSVPSGQYLTVKAMACNSRGCSNNEKYVSSTIRASSCGSSGGGGILLK